MKIAIVGATGMLGQALCREGGLRNNAMSGIARSNTDFSLNLMESDRLEQVLLEIMPDIVINTAAITSLAACTQNPCEAYLVNARAVAAASGSRSHPATSAHTVHVAPSAAARSHLAVGVREYLEAAEARALHVLSVNRDLLEAVARQLIIAREIQEPEAKLWPDQLRRPALPQASEAAVDV